VGVLCLGNNSVRTGYEQHFLGALLPKYAAILFSVSMAEATVNTAESPVETPTSLEDTEKASNEG